MQGVKWRLYIKNQIKIVKLKNKIPAFKNSLHLLNKIGNNEKGLVNS